MVSIEKKTVLGTFILVILVGFGMGCVPVSSNLEALQKPPSRPMAQDTEVVATAPAKRFQDPTTASPTTAESMVKLSEKYTALNDETASLRASNRALGEENDALKLKVVALETDLERAQAELTEANALLMEILGELNTWKSDVLGFRNEMRQAAQAELEALLRILEALGAEGQEAEADVAEPASLHAQSHP
jgi:chromosome segregation ATPase